MEISKKTRAPKAQGNIAGLFIGVLIAAIVGFQVVVPVLENASANMTGTAADIAGLLPLFVALLILVALASPLMRRV